MEPLPHHLQAIQSPIPKPRRIGIWHNGRNTWNTVQRYANITDLSDFPRLLAFCAVPGWGRTTALRELRTRFHDEGNSVIWSVDRETVSGILKSSDHKDPCVLFIDDVIYTEHDPLWQSIRQAAERNPRLRVYLSSIDNPPVDTDKLPQFSVVNEDGLAFSSSQLSELAILNFPEAASGALALEKLPDCGTQLLAYPLVARQMFDEVLSTDRTSEWRLFTFAQNLAPLDSLRLVPSQVWETSIMLQTLALSSRFRRLSAQILERALHSFRGRSGVHANAEMINASHLHFYFLRLRNLPMGTPAVEHSTGQHVFDWSPPIWQDLVTSPLPSIFPIEEADLRKATLAAGHTSMELYYLLIASDFENAETIVSKNLREYLLTADPLLQSVIQRIALREVQDHPFLSLLAVAHRSPGQATRESRAAFRRVKAKLPPIHDLDSIESLRISVARVIAETLIGDRDSAYNSIHELWRQIGPNATAELYSQIFNDESLIDECESYLFLAIWVCAQLDDYAHLHQIIPFARRVLRQPRYSRNYDHAFLDAIDLLFGTSSLENTDEIFGNARILAMAHVDIGDNDGARDLTRARYRELGSQIFNTARRALVILLQAITDPHLLPSTTIAEIVEAERNDWIDWRCSPFVAAAASFAYVTRSEYASAAKVLETSVPDDWFTIVASAVLSIATENPDRAMGELSRLTSHPEMPRTQAIEAVLAAAAHAQLGNTSASNAKLASLTQLDNLGLARFAFRFLSAEDFTLLCTHRKDLPPVIANYMKVCSKDPRFKRSYVKANLTDSEHAVLVLIRGGLTNAQIAERRVVSINTVRTQVRHILRKLGAEDRQEAVAAAERQQLL